MNGLRAIWSEFIGLFVDDGRFAATILVWLALGWLVLPRLAMPSAVPPVILAAGLVAILLDSAIRAVRARRR
jgi:hypothetical protein